MVRIRGALVVPLLARCCSPPLLSPTHKSRFRRPSAELSVDQIRTFLKDAKVIRTRGTEKGVTAPKRLTLTDGTITHDAVFQAIDERKMVANLGGGGRQSTTELNFVDSYKYNIAAYEIARLLGLDHMMPVYVERRWNGQLGSISWFVPTLMDESERLKKKIQPPSPADWNNQMYRMRVFSSLLRDTDRNLTNVLITHRLEGDDDRLLARVPPAAGAAAPEGPREDRSQPARRSWSRSRETRCGRRRRIS